ncbi:MAG: hypothetical protein ABFD46_10525 [Armatimonadota bacterium]
MITVSGSSFDAVTALICPRQRAGGPELPNDDSPVTREHIIRHSEDKLAVHFSKSWQLEMIEQIVSIQNDAKQRKPAAIDMQFQVWASSVEAIAISRSEYDFRHRKKVKAPSAERGKCSQRQNS